MSYDQPSKTRTIDYTTRHRRWELTHQWGPQLGDQDKWVVTLQGRSVSFCKSGKTSTTLPVAVARALADAMLAACDAAEEEA